VALFISVIDAKSPAHPSSFLEKVLSLSIVLNHSYEGTRCSVGQQTISEYPSYDEWKKFHTDSQTYFCILELLWRKWMDCWLGIYFFSVL